jgi:hypothetical protein
MASAVTDAIPGKRKKGTPLPLARKRRPDRGENTACCNHRSSAMQAATANLLFFNSTLKNFLIDIE